MFSCQQQMTQGMENKRRHYTLFKHDLLYCLLILAIATRTSCECNRTCSTASSSCVSSLDERNIRVGIAPSYVCTTSETCGFDTSSTSVDAQQYPVDVLSGTNVTFTLDSPGTPVNYTTGLYLANEASFTSCILATATRRPIATAKHPSPLHVPASLVSTPGLYLLIFDNGNLFGCLFGARLRLLVHSHSCVSENFYQSATSICSGNGVCNKSSNFTCDCCPGYIGEHCQELDGCQSSPCINNGTCTDIALGSSAQDYSCNCTVYFTGNQCQIAVDHCANITCLHNGTCSNDFQHGDFQCTCQPGYSGVLCETDIDDCAGQSCLNNGTCVDAVNGYDCQCESGWSGVNCEVDIDECHQIGACLNNATCNNTAGSFRCSCTFGFTGNRCEDDAIDDCVGNPCSNNAVCVDLYQDFNCTCPNGFEGKTCSDDIDECSRNTCNREGAISCSNSIGSFKCHCIPGYSGQRCESDINECASIPCLNGGLCVNSINSYTCACQSGYLGIRCENVANKCIYKPCSNNGTCSRSGDFLLDYECRCKPGWTGTNCTEDYDECSSTPCLNGATCYDHFNAFNCSCTIGWQGDTCSSNVDICQTQPCINNSTCVDGLVGLNYSCLCHDGFTGKNCESSIDDCATVDCNNGTCVDLVQNYRCRCIAGYFGQHCDTDRDVCALNPCFEGSCDNTNSKLGYICTCLAGWEGVNCSTNTNDCQTSACLNGGTCRDFVSFYNCSCSVGFEGNRCEINVNECAAAPCQYNATCVDLIAGYRCLCSDGYKGVNCSVNIDDCQSSPCDNNGTCTDDINAFHCNCLPGYYGNACEHHVCDEGPCLNGATCLRVATGYECQCMPGYTARNCSVDIDDCEGSMCTNNSTCVDVQNAYTCRCPGGFSGVYCENNLCDMGVCLNDASCSVDNDSLLCTCKPGFTGQFCDQDIDECSSNTCSVIGTQKCIDGINAYKCDCHPGYVGLHCDAHVCNVSSPCRNNATCSLSNTTHGYECYCVVGFTGQNCSVDINDCSSNPCQNSASCVDLVNGYKCRCAPLFTGKHCETDLDGCRSDPCSNNATCLNNNTADANFTCICRSGYFSSRCSEHVCDSGLTHPCKNGSQCVKHDVAGFECLCMPGFHGPHCDLDVDECLSAPCLNGGTCSNMVANYSCHCFQNFTGRNCETEVDYCSGSPCSNNGTCSNDYGNNTFICTCPAHYSGGTCLLHTCDYANPCKNGTCQPVPNGLVCQCAAGFTGRNCSVDIDECASSPCRNNGTCLDSVNGFFCNCSLEFTGGTCDVAISYCTENPCNNSGTCVNDYIGRTFTCLCSENFTGAHCEIPNGACLSNPCAGNGNCTDNGLVSFHCDCYLGFSGQLCEELHCPCTNNGRCVSDNGDVRCVCPMGYSGLLCETFMGDCRNRSVDDLACLLGECVPSSAGYFCRCPTNLMGPQCGIFGGCTQGPCRNGTCIDTGSHPSFVCQCENGFTGQFCNIDINECSTNPCRNGGTCREESINSYTCHCPFGYSGMNCENVATFTSYFSDFSKSTAVESTTRLTLFSSREVGTSWYANTVPSFTNVPIITSLDSMTPALSSTFISSTSEYDRATIITSSGLTQAGSSSMFHFTVHSTYQDTLSATISSLPTVGVYLSQSNSFPLLISTTKLPETSTVGTLSTFKQGFTSSEYGSIESLASYYSLPLTLFSSFSSTPSTLSAFSTSTIIFSSPSHPTSVLASFTHASPSYSTMSTAAAKTSPFINQTGFGASSMEHSDAASRLTTAQHINGTDRSTQLSTATFTVSADLTDLATELQSSRSFHEARTSQLIQLTSLKPTTHGTANRFASSTAAVSERNTSMFASSGKLESSPSITSWSSIAASLGTKSSSIFNDDLLSSSWDSAHFTSVHTFSSVDLSRYSPGSSRLYQTTALSAGSRSSNTRTSSRHTDTLTTSTTSRVSYSGFSLLSTLSDISLSSVYGSELSSVDDVDRTTSYLGSISQSLSGMTTSREYSEWSHLTTFRHSSVLSQLTGFPRPTKTERLVDTSLTSYSSDVLSGEISMRSLVQSDVQSSILLTRTTDTPDVISSYSTTASSYLSTLVDADSSEMSVTTSLLSEYSSSWTQTTLLASVESNIGKSTWIPSFEATSVLPSPPHSDSMISSSTASGNLCDTQPCLNNGVCSTNGTTTLCACLFGFTGLRCTLYNCTCSENGRCVRDGPAYKCVCQVGYTGKLCESFMGDCRTLNCSGNGQCVQRLEGHVCECDGPFSGQFCNVSVQACSPKPCKNGGICVVTGTPTGYACACMPGFQGKMCEFDYDECAVQPCKNGGQCREDVLNDFNCHCNAAATGRYCETLVTSPNISESHASSLLQTAMYRSESLASTSRTPPLSYFDRSSKFQSLSTVSAFTMASSSNSKDISSQYGTEYSSHAPWISSSRISMFSNTTIFLSITDSPPAFTTSSLSVLSSASYAMSMDITPSGFSPVTRSAAESSSLLFAVSSTADAGLLSTSSLFSDDYKTRSSSTVETHHPSQRNTPGLNHSSMTPGGELSLSFVVSSDYTSTRSETTMKTDTETFEFTTSLKGISQSSMLPIVSTTSIEHQATQTLSNLLSRSLQVSLSEKERFSSETIQSIRVTSSYITGSYKSYDTRSYGSSGPSATIPPTLTPVVNMTCVDSPCHGHTCLDEDNGRFNFRCICPYPTFGPRCQTGSVIHFPRFHGSSYLLHYNVSYENVINRVVVTFRTSVSHGLILFAGHETFHDFIHLRVVDSKLEFRCNAGDEVMSLRSEANITTGDLIVVIASQDSRTGMASLTVNDHTTFSLASSSRLRSIQLNSAWFIGGFSALPTVGSVNELSNSTNFTGCIKDLQVNDVPYKIIDASDWLDISECDIDACQRGACLNNATCTQGVEPEEYSCACSSGYQGHDCSLRMDHCQGDPCNGGTCAWTETGHVCLCQYGRHGPDCKQELNITVPTFASFVNYSSYVEYPWQETLRSASQRFEVRLQFKVAPIAEAGNQNCLLVYGGQSKIGDKYDDFFALGLVRNYTVLVFNLGGGVGILKSKQPISTSRAWHSVTVGRMHQYGFMLVDNQDTVYASSPGVLVGLDAYTPLYVGGVPEFKQLPSHVQAYFTKGFSGSIFDVSFRTTQLDFRPLSTQASGNLTTDGVLVGSGLNIGDDSIDECSQQPCENNGTCISEGAAFLCKCAAGWRGMLCHDRLVPCIEYNPCAAGSICTANGEGVACDCQLGWAGTYCSQRIVIDIPYFQNNSYLGLSPLPTSVRFQTKIVLQFKPMLDSGLLFYVSHRHDIRDGDFFAISLWKGFVYVRYSLGAGLASMRSHTTVTIGTWHSLTVDRRYADAVMQLDSNPLIGVRALGASTALDVRSLFYVGGVPQLGFLNEKAIRDVTSQLDFVGCVRKVEINDVPYPLNRTQSMVGRNVLHCHDQCMTDHCQNGGLCKSHSASSILLCNCPIGWNGDRCQSATGNVTRVSLNGDGYVKYRNPNTSPKRDTNLDVTFNTTSDGLLLWYGRPMSLNQDALAVGIAGGEVHVMFRINGHTNEITLAGNIIDGREHVLRIIRTGGTVYIIFDTSPPQLLLLASSNSLLDNRGNIFVGGLPGNVWYATNGKYRSGFKGCLSQLKVTAQSGFINTGHLNISGINVAACG